MSVENAALLRVVQSQRRHVLGILDGLDEAALRASVLPSGWTPLALLNHLALDDERFWFRGVVLGDPEVVAGVEAREPDGWTLEPDVPVEEVFARYRQEAERADQIIADCDLDAEPAWWPQWLFGDYRLGTIREIVLHHLAESATHAGHLDIVRELVDGRQWIVQA